MCQLDKKLENILTGAIPGVVVLDSVEKEIVQAKPSKLICRPSIASAAASSLRFLPCSEYCPTAFDDELLYEIYFWSSCFTIAIVAIITKTVHKKKVYEALMVLSRDTILI